MAYLHHPFQGTIMAPAISIILYNVIRYAKYIWQDFEDFVNFPPEQVVCWCYSKG